MASSPERKRAKSSTEDRKIQQQSVDLSSGTSDGQRRVSVMKGTKINICNDVWYDVFKLSTRAELGLKLALLCRRFDGLADGQLGNTRRQWTLGSIAFRHVKNRRGARLFKYCQKNSGILLEKSALLDVLPPSNLVGFNQIGIRYVDQSVIAFLHRICHHFNNVDITLKLPFLRTEQMRKFVGTHLWPFIAQSVYKLINYGGLRTLVSPTVLQNCANLSVINAGNDFPETPADDRAGASDGQALNKWLHTPRSDGIPKMVTCYSFRPSLASGLAGLKTTFLSAELSVSYIIFVEGFDLKSQLELENQRTRERMTFQQFGGGPPKRSIWLLKRGPTIWWDENKWAEIERKAFGHLSYDEKNLIFCNENMTFGNNFV